MRDGAYPCTQGVKTSLPRNNHPQHRASLPEESPAHLGGRAEHPSHRPTSLRPSVPHIHRRGRTFHERGIVCLGFEGDPVAETPGSPPQPQSCPNPHAAILSQPPRRQRCALLASLGAEHLIDQIIPYLLISSRALSRRLRGPAALPLDAEAVGV